jgi:hypothetical protein
MICQSSGGYDRLVHPIRIIMGMTVVMHAIMKLYFGSEHPGGDNVGAILMELANALSSKDA